MSEKQTYLNNIGGLRVDDEHGSHFRSVGYVGKIDELDGNSSVYGYESTGEDAFSQANPEASRDFDGAVFDLKPGESSSPMRLTKPDYKAVRQAIQGRGHLICVSPDGKVFDHRLDVDDPDPKSVELGEGWIDIVIADRDSPLRVVDVSTPAFKPEFETRLEDGSPEAPELFWQKVSEYKG